MKVRIPTLLAGDGRGGLPFDDLRSPFRSMLIANGFFVIGGDPGRYLWSIDVRGGRKNMDRWESGGRALARFQRRNFPETIYKAGCFNVIAYGAAANPVAFAIKDGLKVHGLITIAAPYKGYTQPLWANVRPRILSRWIHIHAGLPFRTQPIPLADENRKEIFTPPPSLMKPGLWKKREWVKLLTKEVDCGG